MSRSSPVFGTNRKTKHNQFSYIFLHCIPTGFQSIGEAFHYWVLHLRGDTSEYHSFDFLTKEEKLVEVGNDFWHYLTESQVEELELLNWLIEVETNEEDMVKVDENFLEELEKLLNFEEDK